MGESDVVGWLGIRGRRFVVAADFGPEAL